MILDVGVTAIFGLAIAVPDKLTVTVGLSGSFDGMDKCGMSLLPALEGSNVTVTVLDAPAAMVWPDALSSDFVNWAASVPVSEIVPTFRLPDPVLVIVKAWLGLLLELISTEPKILDDR